MTATPVLIDGEQLSCALVEAVAREGLPVSLSDKARTCLQKSRSVVEEQARQGRVVYGVTTGFGKFSDVVISPEQSRDLQRNLILSHSVAVGDLFPGEVVRAILLLRANALAKGYSGIRLCIVERLLEFLNLHIHPAIPQQGSLGASGDLAPLAHMTLALMGEGEVLGANGVRPARTVLAEVGIEPVSLEAKEGLALINGTQVMTGLGVLTLVDALRLSQAADTAAALTFQALRGIPTAYDPRVQQVRPHPGQIHVAERMRRLLQGSRLVTRPGELRVQDAYSLRCIPQVHGAVLQALNHIESVLETEINSATDNPLIFAAEDEVISAGNFHGEPVALALDYLAMAAAELADISERRIERLVNPQLNEGLPAFLATHGGLNSGMMLLQYTAASLVSENKVLTHPASVDSIPSSANQEDHVSMGTTAARKARKVVDNALMVISIELLCAAQALDFRTDNPTRALSPVTAEAYEQVRERSGHLDGDRPLYKDIRRVTEWVRTGGTGRILEDND